MPYAINKLHQAVYALKAVGSLEGVKLTIIKNPWRTLCLPLILGGVHEFVVNLRNTRAHAVGRE